MYRTSENVRRAYSQLYFVRGIGSWGRRNRGLKRIAFAEYYRNAGKKHAFFPSISQIQIQSQCLKYFHNETNDIVIIFNVGGVYLVGISSGRFVVIVCRL